MPENRVNPQPQENENVNRENETENTNGDQFESDTQKIIRRHLEDKDDIITDEDIANVRVGMTPPQFDEATTARFEGEDARKAAEDNLLEGTEDMSKDENLDEGQITPWDTLDPTK
jgi:hypothetical protein